MTETEKRKRLPRDERQSGILDAAIRCAIRSGFHGASMDHIAREAGISVGVIYRHFSSKEAIIEAIVARQIAELQTHIASIGDISGAPLAGLMLDDIGNFLARQRTRSFSALRLEIYAEAARNPRVEAILRSFIETERDLGRELFRRTLPYQAALPELTARADMLRVIADGLLANGLYTTEDSDSFLAVMRQIMTCLLTLPCEPAVAHA